MGKSVFYIKVIHSLLFFVIGVCTLFVFFTAVLDRITVLTWIAFAVTLAELLILIFNDWRCPLTDLAEQRGARLGSVADLFLPTWLSDRLFLIFGIVFSISCLLLFWRLIG